MILLIYILCLDVPFVDVLTACFFFNNNNNCRRLPPCETAMVNLCLSICWCLAPSCGVSSTGKNQTMSTVVAGDAVFNGLIFPGLHGQSALRTQLQNRQIK